MSQRERDLERRVPEIVSTFLDLIEPIWGKGDGQGGLVWREMSQQAQARGLDVPWWMR